jgi:hypothetical protein
MAGNERGPEEEDLEGRALSVRLNSRSHQKPMKGVLNQYGTIAPVESLESRVMP